jgi:protein-tyrosine kinase
MSIVEKALTKLRAADTKAPAAHVEERRAAPPLRGAEQRVAPPVVEEPRPAVAAPSFLESLKRTVDIDMDRLRREHMVPDEISVETADDQFRRIKWPLLEHATGRKASESPRGRLILVTSSLPGEGKTFCALNLAMSLAKDRDINVLLIDADVRKADITRAIGLRSEKGLVDLSSDPTLTVEQVSFRTNIPQLAVLPAGQLEHGVPELWASDRMKQLMQQISTLDSRTVVVIDSSPLLLTNETQVLSRLVGQVAFVVRANTTLQSAALEAITMLDSQARIACLLNGSNEGRGGYYHYGYGTQPGSEPAAGAK